MTCTPIKLPGGVVGIICGPKARSRECKVCGAKTPAARLRECDWKVAAARTCDLLMCVGCSHSPVPGKDLCPDHADIWKARGAT